MATDGGPRTAVPGQAAPGGATHDALRLFVERFADLLAEAGWPRMPARVFACLLADERGRLTAGELADTLGVSPAAISGAVRWLVPLGLVEREREPGDRSDRYRVDDDVWHESFVRRSSTLRRWNDALAQGVALVGAGTEAGRRLEESRRFFAFLDEELEGLMQRWRDGRGARHR